MGWTSVNGGWLLDGVRIKVRWKTILDKLHWLLYPVMFSEVGMYWM